MKNLIKEGKIQVGIIGLGAIGQRLAKSFAANEDIQITAVCDVQEELANQTAEEYGSKPYVDYKQLVEDPGVDLVYIAVPPTYHYAVARDAFAAGKHVLCEKPLANSLEDARAMTKVAEESGLLHALNLPFNYAAPFLKFVELVEQQELGELKRAEIRLRFPHWPRLWQQSSWVGGKEQGGYVKEVGPHFIQGVQRLFGPFKKVRAQLQYPDDPQASEVSVIATFELESGHVVTLDGLSGVVQDEEVSLTAYGSKGTISLRNWGELFTSKEEQALTAVETEAKNPGQWLVQQLVNALRGEQASLYNFEVGLRVQEVLEAIYKSEQTGDWVFIKHK